MILTIEPLRGSFIDILTSVPAGLVIHTVYPPAIDVPEQAVRPFIVTIWYKPSSGILYKSTNFILNFIILV